MRSRALPFAAVALMALHCRPTTVTPAPAAPGAAGARDEERLVLPADFERSGRIAFAPAGYGPVGDETVAPCEVVSAPDGVASLAASVPARLVAWHVAPGEAVRRGQAVVTLDSREVAELRNQVEREQIRVGALTAALAREEGLLSEGATSARDAHAARTELSLARAAVSSARRSLAVAGAAESGPAGRFVLRSPIDGTVVRRDGVLGAVFDPAGAAGVETPVLMLTARDETGERVLGLDAGADDYLTKPFALAEFLARVRALGRRAAPATALSVAGLSLDLVARTVTLPDGSTAELSGREFALLAYLLRHAGRVVPRTELLANVWGTPFDPGTNVVDVYIRHLREKLGAHGRRVTTTRGVGYAFDPS